MVATVLSLYLTVLSFPVAFQNPLSVERLDLPPLEYFFAFGQKKKYSKSPLFKHDLSEKYKNSKVKKKVNYTESFMVL
ncbi:hypothetical protein Hanom_Chr13g01210011 [Helianthus anomalus]